MIDVCIISLLEDVLCADLDVSHKKGNKRCSTSMISGVLLGFLFSVTEN